MMMMMTNDDDENLLSFPLELRYSTKMVWSNAAGLVIIPTLLLLVDLLASYRTE